MTTTCIPQPATITCSISTRPTGTASGLAVIGWIRTAVAAVFSGSGSTGGSLERRATRSTPSEAALDAIDSFPGLRR